ncbi:MAG: hypothetical protein HXX14_19545 [Bacteroidetes bacterium]|nr:hypothetical protein [Bacteroidota bacterium]
MKDELWNILTKTTDWIKHSDTKAVLILTIHGVILTIIYTNSGRVFEYTIYNWVTKLFTLLIATTILGSIIFSFLVINPKLKNNNPTSLIFFGHIQKRFKTHNEYYQAVISTLSTNSNLEEQLAEQIHSTSKIAWTKFYQVTISIRFFFASLVLFTINLLYYFFSK